MLPSGDSATGAPRRRNRPPPAARHERRSREHSRTSGKTRRAFRRWAVAIASAWLPFSAVPRFGSPTAAVPEKTGWRRSREKSRGSWPVQSLARGPQAVPARRLRTRPGGRPRGLEVSISPACPPRARVSGRGTHRSRGRPRAPPRSATSVPRNARTAASGQERSPSEGPGVEAASAEATANISSAARGMAARGRAGRRRPPKG